MNNVRITGDSSKKTCVSEVGKELYELLRELEGLPVTLRVFSSHLWSHGSETTMVIEVADSDGDLIDNCCPLWELTAEGELVEQGMVDDDRTPIEVLQDALDSKQRDKQINVRLSQGELGELREKAKQDGRSISALVRESIGLSS